MVQAIFKVVNGKRELHIHDDIGEQAIFTYAEVQKARERAMNRNKDRKSRFIGAR